MTDLEEELIEFVEEKLREIYEIPYSESICVQTHGSYLDIYMPYVTPDTVHISVNGLLKQVTGISRVSSYLKSKTRFVKNILKNGISCKNVNTPLFLSELKFFERNRRSVLKELSAKQSRLNNMHGFVSGVTSRYALNTSSMELAAELAKINKMFNELKNGESIKEALKGKYDKNLVCSLERGVFTVSYYSYPVFQHDLNDFSFECPFNFSVQTITQYKEFKNFFENKLSDASKRTLSELARLSNIWVKYKNGFELGDSYCGVPYKSLWCTTNDIYTEYFVNSVPINSPEAIEICDGLIENLKGKLAVFNKSAAREFIPFLDTTNKRILDAVRNGSHILSKADILIDGCSIEDTEQRIDSLMQKGYIDVDSGKLIVDKKRCQDIDRLLSLYENARAYIQSCVVNPAKGTEGESENFAEMLNSDWKMEPTNKLKPLNKMSIFEVVAFLKSDQVEYTDGQIKEIISLVDSPIFSEALKDILLEFFEKYDNGKHLPLIKLKYVLLD